MEKTWREFLESIANETSRCSETSVNLIVSSIETVVHGDSFGNTSTSGAWSNFSILQNHLKNDSHQCFPGSSERKSDSGQHRHSQLDGIDHSRSSRHYSTVFPRRTIKNRWASGWTESNEPTALSIEQILGPAWVMFYVCSRSVLTNAFCPFTNVFTARRRMFSKSVLSKIDGRLKWIESFYLDDYQNHLETSSGDITRESLAETIIPTGWTWPDLRVHLVVELCSLSVGWYVWIDGQGLVWRLSECNLSMSFLTVIVIIVLCFYSVYHRWLVFDRQRISHSWLNSIRPWAKPFECSARKRFFKWYRWI